MTKAQFSRKKDQKKNRQKGGALQNPLQEQRKTKQGQTKIKFNKKLIKK